MWLCLDGIQIYDCFIFFSGPGNELLVVVGCCALLGEYMCNYRPMAQVVITFACLFLLDFT